MKRLNAKELRKSKPSKNELKIVKRNPTLETVIKLKKKGVQVVAAEQSHQSTSYKFLSAKVRFPCAVVIGNETYGIEKDVLDESDIIVELPMFGINKSFNVWGTTAVILYKILELL